MKAFFSFVFILMVTICFSQADTARQIEPGQKTSFDNYEVLLLALFGLAILIGMRFWFKRTRKH